jgi:hypothetical protein
MDDRRTAQAGAQNPAYRPAHPLSIHLTFGDYREPARPGHIPGTFAYVRTNALSNE